ncbi:unnamed protein product [Acanthoscelides obtectus]|uniref:Uncharacterized protein n=1 Tax=Acanthoscelides obtectus TaxID=200917 RepID=A0A9P0PNA0_ACAOB|nr:unnamed protein product [Acanthoscelides obtectus]CAK1630859.1 hypothetical protein AOBTE_LOCUS6594 [Acanthoscelides obtectus]
MADATSNTNSVCKKCKSKVVNGSKCAKCETYYHASCARRGNVKTIDDNVMVCCENAIDDDHTAFFDAIESL